MPREAARRDALFIGAFALAAFVAIEGTELCTETFEFIHRNPDLELDAAILAGIITALGLLAFSIRRWLELRREVVARLAAEERQALLAREIDHRAKNALAVMQSVLRLTRADDQKSYVKAVEGRIAALSRAHGLLAKERWDGADLWQTVGEELAAYCGEGRVSLSGPPLRLAAEAVQPVSMVLHELATNAIKHGALSDADGRLALSWDRDPATGDLRLVWEERGGPPIQGAPDRKGFGSALIAATVRGQLGGRLSLDWARTGLRCEMTIAAKHLRHMVPAVQCCAEKTASDATTSLAGRRVLVVEDEPLVAMEMEMILRDLGCEVAGPAATLAEALRLAATVRGLDAAVLDINLGGQGSFPVADLLAGLGVPVLFASGYSQLPPGRVGTAPLLRKPLARDELAVALRGLLARHEADRVPAATALCA